MRWLNSITNSTDMNLNKLWVIVEDTVAWLAIGHGVADSQIGLGDWTTTEIFSQSVMPKLCAVKISKFTHSSHQSFPVSLLTLMIWLKSYSLSCGWDPLEDTQICIRHVICHEETLYKTEGLLDISDSNGSGISLPFDEKMLATMQNSLRTFQNSGKSV